MDTVAEYGSEGPEAPEDETIMGRLYDGYTLTNEQKGNANWLMERQAVAADMRERGIRSYHEYRKIIEIESGKSSRETPSPKSHEAVDRILNEAWNRSLQPEKKRTVTAPDLKEQKRVDSIAEETIRLSEVLPVEEQIAKKIPVRNGLTHWDQKPQERGNFRMTKQKRTCSFVKVFSDSLL